MTECSAGTEYARCVHRMKLNGAIDGVVHGGFEYFSPRFCFSYENVVRDRRIYSVRFSRLDVVHKTQYPALRGAQRERPRF